MNLFLDIFYEKKKITVFLKWILIYSVSKFIIFVNYILYRIPIFIYLW